MLATDLFFTAAKKVTSQRTSPLTILTNSNMFISTYGMLDINESLILLVLLGWFLLSFKMLFACLVGWLVG